MPQEKILRYGATLDEWAHFSVVLGLTGDLLPVVCNPNATISPTSKVKSIGKIPSFYNARHHVVGVHQWTQRTTSAEDIQAWSSCAEYGICVQTRSVRAIDVDIPYAEESKQAYDIIVSTLGFAPPIRSRGESTKFLAVVQLVGDIGKRTITLPGGAIIEFLATGQQFQAIGQHPSGAHYVWAGGLPHKIPEITREKYDELFSALCLGLNGKASTEKLQLKHRKIEDIHKADSTAMYLIDKEFVKSAENDGRLHIVCPFEDLHTSDTGTAATSYFPAHTGGYINGHFKCLHAHCAERSDDDFRTALGISPPDDFANVDDPSVPTEENRYSFIPANEYINRPAPGWIVKNIIPKAPLGMVYGESKSGKSFFILDLLFSVAQGIPWRGFKSVPGAVAYVAAEGAAGARNRIKAHATQHGLNLSSIPFFVLADAPPILDPQAVKETIKALNLIPDLSIVVIDTYASVLQGGDENSSTDTGKAIAHCVAIHRHTGATVILVHHSGKDASKGARGHSSMPAALDFELAVLRNGSERTAVITKQKDGSDDRKLEFGFKLIPVEIGTDEDGEPITSCYVDHKGSNAPGVRPIESPKEGLEVIILSVIADSCSGGVPISYQGLKDEVLNQLPATGNARNQTTRIAKALEKLISLKHIQTCAGGGLLPTSDQS